MYTQKSQDLAFRFHCFYMKTLKSASMLEEVMHDYSSCSFFFVIDHNYTRNGKCDTESHLQMQILKA